MNVGGGIMYIERRISRYWDCGGLRTPWKVDRWWEASGVASGMSCILSSSSSSMAGMGRLRGDICSSPSNSSSSSSSSSSCSSSYSSSGSSALEEADESFLSRDCMKRLSVDGVGKKRGATSTGG